MRNLTLNEKISIKSKLANRGIYPLPKLTMRAAIHYWTMISCKSIKYWHKFK